MPLKRAPKKQYSLMMIINRIIIIITIIGVYAAAVSEIN
jgi:hypothetical protein